MTLGYMLIKFICDVAHFFTAHATQWIATAYKTVASAHHISMPTLTASPLHAQRAPIISPHRMAYPSISPTTEYDACISPIFAKKDFL